MFGDRFCAFSARWLILVAGSRFLYPPHGNGSAGEHDAGDDQHHGLVGGTVGGVGDEVQDDAAEDGCNNLGQADGAVEESEVCAHVSLPGEGVCE